MICKCCSTPLTANVHHRRKMSNHSLIPFHSTGWYKDLCVRPLNRYGQSSRGRSRPWHQDWVSINNWLVDVLTVDGLARQSPRGRDWMHCVRELSRLQLLSSRIHCIVASSLVRRSVVSGCRAILADETRVRSYFSCYYVVSNTRTVVRECCKDDDRSQWES